MKIVIKNKTNGKIAGFIHSPMFCDRATIILTYKSNPQVIKDIQEVLLKHYNLKYVSGEGGKSPSSLLLDGVEITESKNQHKRMRSSQNTRRKS